MAARAGRPTEADGVPSRCQCGHFRTAHMRTRPADPARPDGSYRLVADGPCEICGEGRCGGFAVRA
jgi:hypothetical protein